MLFGSVHFQIQILLPQHYNSMFCHSSAMIGRYPGALVTPALSEHLHVTVAGNLTKLSSLTFLTPMFAAFFG